MRTVSYGSLSLFSLLMMTDEQTAPALTPFPGWMNLRACMTIDADYEGHRRAQLSQSIGIFRLSTRSRMRGNGRGKKYRYVTPGKSNISIGATNKRISQMAFGTLLEVDVDSTQADNGLFQSSSARSSCIQVTQNEDQNEVITNVKSQPKDSG